MKNKAIKFMHKLKTLLVFLGLFFVLLIIVKGDLGDGLEQARGLTVPGQAFESSLSRARYALTQSLVDENRWDLSPEMASFAVPDVAIAGEDRYVSIFPPGTSFFMTPFYIAGRAVNLGQLSVSFSFVALGVLSSYLIYRLGRKLDLSSKVSLFAGALFLFASNALAYSTIISQHLLSTAILLLGVHIVLMRRSVFKHLLFWFFYGLSALVDIPNLILMLPLAFYLFFTDAFIIKSKSKKINLKFRYWYIFLIIITVVPLAVYGFYNLKSAGDITSVAQFSRRFEGFEKSVTDLKPLGNRGIFASFDVTRMPSGLSVLLFGFERGISLYFPVFLLAVFGIKRLYQQSKAKTYMLAGIVVVSLFLYSMWGDPWGGWAFGPRYLIPTFSILALFVAKALETFYRNVVFVASLVLLSLYSTFMSVLGAITTTLIPPVHEAAGLGLDPTINNLFVHLYEKPLGSFVYTSVLVKYMNNIQFYLLIAISAALIIFLVFWRSLIFLQNHETDK